MKNLLVSFSGGETSAFMAQWLWKNKRSEYNMIFVFANTGQENEETLEFVQKCSNYFGFPVVWVEAVVHFGKRKGCTHKIVDFKTASRNGEPFEEVVKKYGIPNQSFPHCTRETKLNPINSYAKSIGWKNYYTAIGLRNDEIDRVSKKAKAKKLIYPLISMHQMNKPMINFFFKQQPFRLQLKGYQGNCKWCWKKHDPKLYQIANEDISKFDFPLLVEKKYSNFIPPSRLKLMKARGENTETPNYFFRKNRSTIDILEEAQKFKGIVIDDAEFESAGSESCEIYTECGIDN